MTAHLTEDNKPRPCASCGATDCGHLRNYLPLASGLHAPQTNPNDKELNGASAKDSAEMKKWDEIEQRFLNGWMNREFTRWLENHLQDMPKQEQLL